MNELFNIPVATPALTAAAAAAAHPAPAPAAAAAVAITPAPEAAVPVFTSGQTVITFPAASGLISITWKVLGNVNPSFATNKYIPLGLALLIGMLIYLQSRTKGLTLQAKLTEGLFAILNSFTLAATALGIDAATTQAPPPTS